MLKTDPTLDRKNATATRRFDVRARFEQLRASRRRRMLGLPEMIALAAAAVLLIAAVSSYFLLLAPERARLEAKQEERRKLQTLLRDSTEGVKRGESTQATVDEIVQSLQDFEAVHLSSLRSEGSTALIEELNRLIRTNNLRLATGVSFTQFDEVVPGATAQQRSPVSTGAVKALQNIFPGIGISLTVEGTYGNVRRFIRDVEADRQFIVINTVELEGISDAAAARTAGGEESPAAGSTLVSLRLEMAAYYRRANAPDQQTLLQSDGGGSSGTTTTAR